MSGPSDGTCRFDTFVVGSSDRLAFGDVRERKGALNTHSAFPPLEGTPVAPPDVRAGLGERASSAPAPTPVSVSSHPPRLEATFPDGTDDEGFLADVLQDVEARVEPWRVVLGEAMSRWKSQGYSIAVLERARNLPTAPDVDGLIATFTAAIDYLRSLEAQASRLDPALRGHAAFRDVASIPLAQQLLARAMAGTLPLPAPSPAYTRERLDIRSANQLAVQAIDAVIVNPGIRYNPLFLCGPAGSGKSHLAHALGNAMRAGAAVACLSASAFVDELIAARQEGGMERWRLRFRAADVFILDDVEALAGNERTQEELFHLFNHLYERGSQIVLTSKHPPRELSELADRLRSRFEGGLVVALQPRERHRVEPLVERAPGELDRFFEDREKTMWSLPDLGGRLIEEYR
jgi:hypothetical protein